MRKSVRYSNQILLASLNEVASKCGKSVAQIAEEISVSESNLYKQLSDTSGVDFKLRYLLPFMRATGSARPLMILAQKVGYILVKKPRGYKSLHHMKIDLNRYQREFHVAMGYLMEFISNPSSEKLRQLEDMLFDHMSRTESIRRHCRSNPNQTDMFSEVI